jgi:hypothetical protein
MIVETLTRGAGVKTEGGLVQAPTREREGHPEVVAGAEVPVMIIKEAILDPNLDFQI